MRWLRGIHNLWREYQSVSRILSLPEEQRRLVVYSEDSASYNQYQGYLDVLRHEHRQDMLYVTSDPRPAAVQRAPGHDRVLRATARRHASALALAAVPASHG